MFTHLNTRVSWTFVIFVFLPFDSHEIKFFFCALLIIIFSHLATNEKSPCLNPLLHTISFSVSPFMSMFILANSNHFLIHCLLLPNPMASSVYITHFQLTGSYAFLKSSISKKPASNDFSLSVLSLVLSQFLLVCSSVI